MRNIIYYVAASLDGYIAGPQGDVSQFMHAGNGVTQYQQDLLEFDTVIMGRKTYEFGYAYGLKAGQPAYPHMQHCIFSTHLRFADPHPQVQVCPLDIKRVQALKAGSGTDIYLCGGGQFAGWLLDHQLIDILKIKLNPLILGGGTRLFGDSQQQASFHLVDQANYEGGMQIITYKISSR